MTCHIFDTSYVIRSVIQYLIGKLSVLVKMSLEGIVLAVLFLASVRTLIHYVNGAFLFSNAHHCTVSDRGIVWILD